MPTIGGLLCDLRKRQRLKLSQVGLTINKVVQPDHTKIAAIDGVVTLTTNGLPASVMMVDDGLNGAFVCKNVRANNAKNLAHPSRMANFRSVDNGWKPDIAFRQKLSSQLPRRVTANVASGV